MSKHSLDESERGFYVTLAKKIKYVPVPSARAVRKRLTAIRFGKRIVKVHVGPHGVFFVDHAALCATSPYFQAAFNHAWQEAEENLITLDEDPQTFEIYLNYVYTRRLCMEDPVTLSDAHAAVFQLSKCYIMGDVFQDIDFMNHVMRCLIHRLTDDHAPVRPLFCWKDIRMIWHGTMPGSPLRKLVLLVLSDAKVADVSPSIKTQLLVIIPTEFWLDQITFLQDRKSLAPYDYRLLKPDPFLLAAKQGGPLPPLQPRSTKHDSRNQDQSTLAGFRFTFGDPDRITK